MEHKNQKKISIVTPVYNEEAIINQTIKTLCDFCEKNLRDYDWRIVIVDNNSTDRTPEIAKELEKESGGKIIYKFIHQKGKGLAINEGWKSYDADIYVFMDVDLATDLSALPILIKELENGNDLVIGSRFVKGSSVKRQSVRKITSKIFSLITRFMFGLKIKDYPCGFKGANKNVIKNILPEVKNNQFFFDTELVIRSAKKGLKVKEIPVIWQDRDRNKSKSRVSILKVTKEYLRELLKLKKALSCHSRAGRPQVSPIISATRNPDSIADDLDSRFHGNDRKIQDDDSDDLAISK